MRRALVLALAVAAAAAHADENSDVFDVEDPVLEAPRPTTATTAATQVLQQGAASWYGLPFHGRRTASGERFDMNALTAAHPWLPFGTRVVVRSPHNGRSVTVRINDRGPHIGGRIIDLSHAAAKALGLLGLGTRGVVLTLAD